MMIEVATVLAYQNGIAEVQCQAQNGCGSCAASNVCGTRALSALSGEKEAPRFSLEVDEALNVGDKIRLGLPKQTLLNAIFWLYGVPLATLILSSLLLSLCLENELILAAIALLLTVMSFVLVRYHLARQTKQFMPQFLGKVG